MKLGLLLSTLMLSSPVLAGPTILPLWPEGVPGRIAGLGPEKRAGDLVSNIDVPTLTLYPAPKERANGTAVVVCPGGGYTVLAIGHEGADVAAWLNRLGVDAFVLKYRLREYGHPAPLQDVLRAIRLVRSGAAGFGVRPDRIGVIGFSAGGHLAACAGTLYDSPDGKTGASLDAVSARPNFMILLYPVITLTGRFADVGSREALLGPHPSAARLEELSVARHVTPRTPPAFLVTTDEDTTVPAENCLLFYEAMRRAGVPGELHVFLKGIHGLGLRPGHGSFSEWPHLCENWLRASGWIPPVSSP